MPARLMINLLFGVLARVIAIVGRKFYMRYDHDERRELNWILCDFEFAEMTKKWLRTICGVTMG